MSLKKPRYDLRRSYPVFIETGIIIVLLLLIGFTKIPVREKQTTFYVYELSEDPALILPLAIKEAPMLTPPPPMPDVPVTLPDDSPIEPPELEFSEFNLTDELEIPPLAEELIIEVDWDLLKGIEVLPQMIGGEKAFKSYLRYPRGALKNKVEGIVEVEFYVNTNGDVVNPVIVQSLGWGCDEMVLNAIKKQRYIPGKLNGEIAEFKIKETVQFIIIDLH